MKCEFCQDEKATVFGLTEWGEKHCCDVCFSFYQVKPLPLRGEQMKLVDAIRTVEMDMLPAEKRHWQETGQREEHHYKALLALIETAYEKLNQEEPEDE